MAEQIIISMYGAMVSWTYILLTVLLIVKFMQLAGSIKGSGFKLPDWLKPGGSEEPTPGEDREYRKQGKPGKVYMFRAIPQGSQVALSWSANPEVDGVNYYEIHKAVGRKKLTGATHWRRIATPDKHHPPNNPLMDEGEEGVNRYRIRAVNSKGPGKWTPSEATITRPIKRWHPVIDSVNVDQQGNTTFKGRVEIR